jgi:hypothetical protein
MDGAEGRSDQMLMPALGDRRLAREQGAEILKRDVVRQQREQRNGNAD